MDENEERAMGSPTHQAQDLRRLAEKYLGGDPGAAATADDVLELAENLNDLGDFGTARTVLKKRIDAGLAPAMRDRFTHQIVLATYKDTELRNVDALKNALEIVTGGPTVEQPPESEDPDAYGIPGAIHKRLFSVTGDRRYLELSLRYYETGWQKLDDHYNGVNAAFVHDLLAAELVPSSAADAHRDAAGRIRAEIIRLIEPNIGDDWAFNSLIQCYVGTGRPAKALEALQARAAGVAEPNWRGETCVRQIATLISLRRRLVADEVDALPVLAELTGFSADGESNRRQLEVYADGLSRRFGVAFSGGGFRASLFHLGVLAAMAELDLLRRIEVLSCVSGGSIVGAHYALHLRNLLEDEAKPDPGITAEDYRLVVEKCISTFVDAVTTKNIRLLAFAPTGWPHVLRRGHNLSTRLGQLYERHLYAAAQPLSNGGMPVTALKFEIAGTAPGSTLNPKRDNWRRLAKVPIVILNATSLNTGYNWQFAATWMGEPPIPVDKRIDSLDYCERIYYEHLDEQQRPTLGAAVAASSCVPGLFPPVPLTGLVEHRTVQLVDGGVQDNQGTSALLDHDCTALFVSDASGQISHADTPRRTRLPSLFRSSSLSRASLRTRGFNEILSLVGQRVPVWYIHLTNELRPGRRRFLRGPDYDYYVPGRDSGVPWTVNQRQTTGYDIPREMQQALAEIRTDIDRFSHFEANALMYSGYQQTLHAFERRAEHDFPLPTRTPYDGWSFLAIRQVIENGGSEYEQGLRTLRKGRYPFFRRLRRGRRSVGSQS